MKASQIKNLFMIGGPNGAGKTTSAFSLMPELIHCDEYVNADAIAFSLSPFKPESIGVKAGKLMLSRIEELANHNLNFAFETTMASKTFTHLINRCKQEGYFINILYVWLNDPDLAIQRVNSRVEKGGHSIEESVIRRRYVRSMYNLINLYIPLADGWSIVDNSSLELKPVAKKLQRSATIDVYDNTTWKKFEDLKP
ncbi:zeta toxin family protein [Nitrospira sp. BLG_2]|uniref:zeta toxin family protein n=1 Tax=Nitrospira sp. BLG_2 TaxID=3397507 RepID=UPI003B9C88E9